MTKQEAAALVALAAASYPSMQQRDPMPIIAAWALMLADIPAEVGKAAVVKVCRESDFFPSVAQIVAAAELIDPRTDELPSSADAWGEVYKQIQYTGQYRIPTWTNPVIARAVSAMGWTQLCEGENLEADRAHFLRIYESMRSGHKDRAEGNKALELSGMMDVVMAMAGKIGLPEIEAKHVSENQTSQADRPQIVRVK